MIKLLNWKQNDFEDGWILNCDWASLSSNLSQLNISRDENIEVHLFLLNSSFSEKDKETIRLVLSDEIFEKVFRGINVELIVQVFNEGKIPLSKIEEAINKNKRNIVIIDNGSSWHSIQEVGRSSKDDMIVTDTSFLLRMKYILDKKRANHKTDVFWIRRDWNKEYRWKFLKLNEDYCKQAKNVPLLEYSEIDDMKSFMSKKEDELSASRWGATHLLNPNERKLPSDFRFKGALIGAQLFSSIAVHKKSRKEGVFHNGQFNLLLEPYFTVGSLSEVEIREMDFDNDADKPQFLNVTLNIAQSDQALFELLEKIINLRPLVFGEHNKEKLVVRTPEKYDEILAVCISYFQKRKEVEGLSAKAFIDNYGSETNSSVEEKKLNAGLYIIKNINSFDFKL